MSRLGPRARKRISERINGHADEIENSILADRVLMVDDGAPEELHHIAKATSVTHHAMSCTRDPDADETPINDKMSEAHWESIDALSELIDQLVAEACAHVISHADEWAARDANEDNDVLVRRDPEEYEAAKEEAQKWLKENDGIARRAGVLDQVE